MKIYLVTKTINNGYWEMHKTLPCSTIEIAEVKKRELEEEFQTKYIGSEEKHMKLARLSVNIKETELIKQ